MRTISTFLLLSFIGTLLPPACANQFWDGLNNVLSNLGGTTSGSPTNAPVAAPVQVTSTITAPPTKVPIASSIASPTKAPVASTNGQVASTSAPSYKASSGGPETVETVPGSMTLYGATDFSVNASSFISSWESYTSQFITNYFETNSTKVEGLQVTTVYESVEQGKTKHHFVIHFNLVIGYTSSSISVIKIAKQPFGTQTSKDVYTSGLLRAGYDLECRKVEYPLPSGSPTKAPVASPVAVTSTMSSPVAAPTSSPVAAPTSSPVTASPTTSPVAVPVQAIPTTSSPVAAPIAATVTTTTSPVATSITAATVPGSMTFSSFDGQFNFSSTEITVWEKATSEYITQYYSNSDKVQGLTCTANYDSSEYDETQGFLIVYFSTDLEYEYSTYSPTEIVQKPFSSTAAQAAFNGVLKKLGYNLQLESVTATEQARIGQSVSSAQFSESDAIKANTGLLSLIVGAIGSALILLA